MKITKAVFPVAGLGTRFFPATKSIPKEMLPIVDKPLIQYAVNEAISAGVETLIFVNGKNKRSIEDYFDRDVELEDRLKENGKLENLVQLRSIIPDDIACVYLRQFSPRGLGHAVSCARPVIDSEPFAVILADDLIDTNGSSSVLEQLVEVYEEYQCSVIAVEEVAQSKVDKYGIISGVSVSDKVLQVSNLIEKPTIKEAPSNLAIIGRYILTPDIFSLLAKGQAGSQGEIQLTDALIEQLKTKKIMACKFSGERYDCGNKFDYLRANIKLGLRHPEIGDKLGECLKTLN